MSISYYTRVCSWHAARRAMRLKSLTWSRMKFDALDRSATADARMGRPRPENGKALEGGGLPANQFPRPLFQSFRGSVADKTGAVITAYAGNRRVAMQPLVPSRFARVRVPPWFSAICRQSTNPIPLPSVFVVKNGTNKLVACAMPGPSSSTNRSTPVLVLAQPIRTPAFSRPAARCSSAASTAFFTRLMTSCSIYASSQVRVSSGPAHSWTPSLVSSAMTR